MNTTSQPPVTFRSVMPYLLVLCFVFIGAATYGQSHRKKINLDEGWKFHFGHANDPSKDFNFGIANIFAKTSKAEGTAISPKFDDSKWRSLNLPHDWAVELPFVNSENFDVMSHGYKPVGGLFPETSIGWYRKQFELQPADSGSRIAIQFDGIFRDATIWINGFYVGTNESGYIGATYDVTDYLNYKKPNLVVVRVDATQYEGWFYEGAGIYRHVWLLQYDQIHLDPTEVFVHSTVKDGKASVVVESGIINEGSTTADVSIQSVVSSRDGNVVVRSKQVPVNANGLDVARIQHTLAINNPSLWSLDNPYLYRLEVIVLQGDKVIDKVTTRFGIRTVEVDAVKGLLLNGKPIKIKGVNCHQDHAGVGSALPDYLQYYRIRLLKEMGVNAYRTSHNPPTPELLDACDSLGMLVMDETRLLNSSPEYMDQFERMIKRDRNHPSIYMWSIGNEEGYVQKNSHGKRLALTMMARQTKLDPTRTSTYAADMANEYRGINEVIPVRGFNYREKGMVPYHKDHPDQPVVGTEMGSTVTTRGIYVVDSVRCYVPDQDITFPWWASRAEDWWPIAANNEWLMGGFVWTGFDYRGEPTPYHWPNINSHFGIMDMCGFPKNIYYYYQSWWSKDDVIHISPHWNWKGKEGERIEVWVNSNAEQVELFLNGKSLGKKVMARNSHLKWQVSYKSGKLEAVGIRQGRKIRTSMETTGEAYQLVLSPDRKLITANGTDATVINVTVVDSKGREVPDANQLINFKLSGSAAIIGLGNGDPSCHESDKCTDEGCSRSLFNGKCQLILQAGKSEGQVTVEASASGIKTTSAVIALIASK